jgi:hypothetical protein
MMKLFHFLNTARGDWSQNLYENGRRWFFDRNTVLTHWLPYQRDIRDSFHVVVIEINPDHVYETHEYIDNDRIQRHIGGALAYKKSVIGGIWDRDGSRQYYLISDKNISMQKIERVLLSELDNFVRNETERRAT